MLEYLEHNHGGWSGNAGNPVSDCFHRKFLPSCDKLGECSEKATCLETNFVYLAGYSGNDIGLSPYRLWQGTLFGELLLLANFMVGVQGNCYDAVA